MRLLLRLLALALVLSGGALLAQPASAFSPAAGPVPSPATGPSTTYADQAHRATNRQRVKHHRHQLKVDGCMVRFAARQARTIAASQNVDHNLRLDRVQHACNLHYVIEQNARGAETGTQMINQVFMGDRYVRNQVVLRASHRFMGMGAAQSESGEWFFVALFAERT